ncbi:MAG: hypothetical protein DMG21_00025 [Acidobacteria bacterium]|nr:MAG: hypothetical protein DMG21_00025 [Acidobacteriota bacterium]
MATISFSLDIKPEEARRQLRASSEIVNVAPSGASLEARNLFREGIELLDAGEPREAIAKFENAVFRFPAYSDGYVGLGIAYAMDSQVYPALDSFRKAAEADPENFFAHFKLAQFYFKLRVPKKGYDEASRALQCATAIEERRLVARILKEERTREAGGVPRPTWDKPFSPTAVRAGIGLLLVAVAFLVRAVAR